MLRKGIFIVLLAIFVLWYLKEDKAFPKDGASGKRVLITGASSGIGEELAYQYARHGASVFVTARREERLKQVVSRCKELGSPDAVFGYFVADMKKYKMESKRLVEAGVKHMGGLDTVIVNHLLVPAENKLFKGSESDLTDFDEMIEVNFKSYVHIVGHTLPHLRKSGTGRIGVTGSLAGKFPLAFSPGYCGAKFALDGFFSSLRLELSQSESGITVTYGVLGAIDTELMQGELENMHVIGTNQGIPEVVDWVKMVRSMLMNAADTSRAIMVATETGEAEFYYPARVSNYIPIYMRGLAAARALFPALELYKAPQKLMQYYKEL